MLVVGWFNNSRWLSSTIDTSISGRMGGLFGRKQDDMKIDCLKCGRWFKPKNKKLSNYHICPDCDKHFEELREDFKNPAYLKEYNAELKRQAKQ